MIEPRAVPLSDWQQGVVSMANNTRAALTWSHELLRRGHSPEEVLNRMDDWLRRVIEQLTP